MRGVGQAADLKSMPQVLASGEVPGGSTGPHQAEPARRRVAGLVAVLVPVDLSVLFLRPRTWIGTWPDTGVAAQLPALYVALVAAGGAAWISASRRRPGSPVPTVTVADELVGCAHAVAACLLSYAVGCLAASILTARASPGAGVGLALGHLLLGALLCLLGVVWGWAAGQHGGRLSAAIVASATFLVTTSVLGSRQLLHLASTDVWLRVSPSTLAVRLVAVLLLLAVVALAPAASNRGGRVLGQLLVALGLAAVCAATLGTSTLAVRTPATRPVCVPGAIELCLWPEHAHHLPVVERVAARVGSLPGGLRTPARLWEAGLGVPVLDSQAERYTISITEGNESALALSVAAAVIGESFADCDLQGIRDDPLLPSALQRWTEDRLAGTSHPAYRALGVPDVMQRGWDLADEVFEELPADAQDRWVEERLARVRAAHCTG